MLRGREGRATARSGWRDGLGMCDAPAQYWLSCRRRVYCQAFDVHAQAVPAARVTTARDQGVGVAGGVTGVTVAPGTVVVPGTTGTPPGPVAGPTGRAALTK